MHPSVVRSSRAVVAPVVPIRAVRAAAALTLLSLAVAAPLHAQRPIAELSPYAGYLFAGDYLDGPLGTSVGAHNGTLLGAQLALNLTPSIAVVGHVARASSDLEIGVPFLGGVGVGSSEVWLMDGGLQLSAPALSRGGAGIVPFVQIGAGAARHELSGAGILRTNSTNFAFNAGLGADLMLGRNVGLRLLAKDYVGKFDVQEAGGVDAEGRIGHNVALSVGLKLGF